MKIGVIADDLTGGNGTGVKLTKLGFNVATMVNYNNIPTDEQTNAVVIDTDSRYVTEKVAAKRMAVAVENLKKWDATIVCKRIDSTVRGNIGVEIDTLLAHMSSNSVIVLTPAYPESDRVVSGGYLLVKGKPVQLSDVSKDPVKPVVDSYVPHIIQQQSEHPVAHIPLTMILSGEEQLAEEMRRQIDAGNKILVVDSISEEDIETVAHAMMQVQGVNFIPSDPGPLTAAYARAFALKYKSDKKIIVTVGSVTSNSHKQLNYLMDKRQLKPVYVDPKKLATMSSEAWEAEVERVYEQALREMEEQDVIIVTTDSPFAEIINFKKIAEREGVQEGYLAKRISDGLAKITRKLVNNSGYEMGGLFTSGGDVTASVSAIGLVEGIRLNDEILPLIAYGYFIGGHFDGLPIVTKGGTAGDENAIYTCVKYLESKY